MIYDFNENVLKIKKGMKRDIKRTSGRCAAILLLLAIITYFLGNVIINILGMNGITSDENSKELYNFFVGYFPCIIADITAICVCMVVFKQSIKRYLGKPEKLSLPFMISGALSSLGIGIISSIIFLIYSGIIKSKGIEIPSPDFSIPQSNIFFILFISYTCIIAPIFEEIIFRGYILNNMCKYGNIIGIVMTSIFFSMFHFNLVQFINPVFMGIVLSFIALRSKSIIPSIAVHMFNNMIAMATTVVSSNCSNNVVLMWTSIYYIGGISALFYFFLKYGKEFVNIAKEKHSFLSIKRKFFYSVFNIGTIAYIIFYIFFVSITIISKNM